MLLNGEKVLNSSLDELSGSSGWNVWEGSELSIFDNIRLQTLRDLLFSAETRLIRTFISGSTSALVPWSITSPWLISTGVGWSYK